MCWYWHWQLRATSDGEASEGKGEGGEAADSMIRLASLVNYYGLWNATLGRVQKRRECGK